MIGRQLVGYGLVGVAQVVLDWGVFVLATALGANVIASNLFSRSVGAVLGFWLNGKYTFATGTKPKLGRRQSIRYVVAWLAMAALSTGAVHLIDGISGLRVAWSLKPAIDIALAGLGFVVSKYWIYR